MPLPDHETDPVTRVLLAYKAAVFAKDVHAFADLYDQDVLVFDEWGPWQYRGIDAWRSVAHEWFLSLGVDRVVVDMEELQAHVAGDLAAGHALLRCTAITDSGRTLGARDKRMTLLLRRSLSGWKIIHEHSSAPADSTSRQKL